MIKAQNLVRKYGDFTAVNGVSFEIPRGQIVGLLGHNGAGKTTIIKMLTGYLEPTSGEVLIDGTDIGADRLKVQEKIGYLPENCPLYPEMTVMDYLHYVAELRALPEQTRLKAVHSAVTRTRLEEKATAPITTLSKGYRQRTGVAQAILHNPDILILDEPTSGLDPSQINEIRSLIKDLSSHSTVILSTHILQEVQAVCDRVIIISQGKVILDSQLDELRKSSRLIVSLDRGPEEAKRGLGKLNGVRSVDHVGVEEGRHIYTVETSQNGADLSPLIAKTVVDLGFNLYALHREQRDLETVFREINAAMIGGGNAN